MSKGFLCRGPVYSVLTGPGSPGVRWCSTVMKTSSESPTLHKSWTRNSPEPEGVVAGHAGLVGDAPRRAVRRVLLALAGGEHRPEVVEHVFVRRQALARKKPDLPDLDPIVFRQQPAADAVVLGGAGKLGAHFGRPSREVGAGHTAGQPRRGRRSLARLGLRRRHDRSLAMHFACQGPSIEPVVINV